MGYFPLYLNLETKKILLIGGGNIAYEKLKKLLQFTKNINLLAKEFNEDILLEIKKHSLKYLKKEYKKGDIDGFDIVIVAIDDILLQEEIFKESRDKKILVNCVDNINFCDFIFPSIIKEEDLIISISTSGASPAFSKELKIYIKNRLPKDINIFLKHLKTLRNRLPKGKKRMEFLKKVVKEYFDSNK